MKPIKIICKLLGLAVLLCTAALAAGCSQWDSPYLDLDEKGYTVSVRFDSNGGELGNRAKVNIVDVFRLEDGEDDGNGNKQFRLLSTDDPRRGELNVMPPSRANYMFAGWYRERIPVLDADGNHLDFEGNITTDEGTYAYTYRGRWNFDTDVVTVNPADVSTSEENVLTLYAGWVHNYTYKFYMQDETGAWVEYKTVHQSSPLNIPEWVEGAMDMKNFPQRENMTIEGVFGDAEMTVPLTEPLVGAIDYETGTSLTPLTEVYTTWTEGTWFQIRTADDFIKYGRPGGSYLIYDDLDFTGKNWSQALVKNLYTGTIKSADGNTYAFKNITAKQTDNKSLRNGIFGGLASGSKIENVVFENATFHIVSGSTAKAAAYGLLAGEIQEGATLSGVTVSGKIVFGKSMTPMKANYDMGLLCADGNYGNMDISHITVEIEAPENFKISYTVDPETGKINLTVNF